MHNPLLAIWGGLQRQLFPTLEDELGPLTNADREFVETLAVFQPHLDTLLAPFAYGGIGAKPKARRALLLAFIAKPIYQFATTTALIEALHARPTLRRLCGFDSPQAIPDESTFSRAFGAFATGGVPSRLHAALIHAHGQHKLVGHVSRDSTAIEARETISQRPTPPPPPPHKRGRPRKDEHRPPPPPKRLDLQLTRSLAANVAELPCHCDWGCKTNRQGKTAFWRGYKLHLDVGDGDIPLSAVLTAASLHDSQAAIPLAQLTAQRVQSLYDLMDSAYDAQPIRTMSERLGPVAIIAPNPRRGTALPLAPARAQRFDQRTAAERVHALLKDRYGGRWVRVRGGVKVMAHLLFAVVALTASQLLRQLVT